MRTWLDTDGTALEKTKSLLLTSYVETIPLGPLWKKKTAGLDCVKGSVTQRGGLDVSQTHRTQFASC